jgi:anti-anti-sigma factor
MESTVRDDTLVITFNDNLVASNLDDQLKFIKKAVELYPQPTLLELNFENVQEIDSLGINLVVGLYKQMENDSKKICVVNAIRPIKNLFNLFKLDTYFPIS